MRRAPCHCALRMLARKLSYRFFLPSCPVPYTCRLLLHARFLSTNRSQEVSVAYSRSSRERMGGDTFMYIEHPLLSPPHLSSLSLLSLASLPPSTLSMPIAMVEITAFIGAVFRREAREWKGGREIDNCRQRCHGRRAPFAACRTALRS